MKSSKAVLVAGISGSGKSTICHDFKDHAVVVELDGILLTAYQKLNVGAEGGDPFSYAVWAEFLANSNRYRDFRGFVQSYISMQLQEHQSPVVFVVGNHFVIPSILDVMTEVLTASYVEAIHRIALSVADEKVLAQRLRRGNPYDIEMTLDKVSKEAERLRSSLSKHDFQFLNEPDCRSTLSELVSLVPVT